MEDKNLIQEELKELSPTLLHVREVTKASDGFKMPPPQYFDAFYGNLQSKYLSDTDFADTLKKTAAKEDGFIAPDGYFESLTEKIAAKVKIDSKHQPVLAVEKTAHARGFSWRKWAAAAAVILGGAWAFNALQKPAELPKNSGQTVVVEVPKTPDSPVVAPPNEIKQLLPIQTEKKQNLALNPSEPAPSNSSNLPSVAALQNVNVAAELDKIFDDLEENDADLQDVFQLTDEELESIAEESEEGI